DSADLTQLFEQVARHVAATLASIHQERADVQALLREVSARLTEFGAHLAAADNSSSEGECARDRMSEDINAELHEIVRAFDGPENIGTLQLQVQRHLEQLRFHIQRFDDVEKSRRSRDRSEREQLKGCIAGLEKETARLRQELAAAKRNAAHDSLTELPNRRGYEATLMREVARSQRVDSPLSLVALDADHFKRINDTFGHPVGDEVLRTLARIIKKSVRRNDYPARVGGEEFFLLLPDTALPEALTIAEKVRRRIEKTHFHMKGTPVEVTVSAGVGQFNPTQGVDALHQVVDAALYAAKQAGRNRCRPAADSAPVD
ncbi:MAG: GGDEF domain-containing protein, partial [Pseudomonadota bacterium]|nr:GGDEF domain-containing protein [Pseudomonadota bacterium]